MLATYMGMRTVKDLVMERLIIKMTDSATLDDSEQVIRDIKASLPDEVSQQLKVKKDKA
jgi:hypothetical protein